VTGYESFFAILNSWSISSALLNNAVAEESKRMGLRLRSPKIASAAGHMVTEGAGRKGARRRFGLHLGADDYITKHFVEVS